MIDIQQWLMFYTFIGSTQAPSTVHFSDLSIESL